MTPRGRIVSNSFLVLMITTAMNDGPLRAQPPPPAPVEVPTEQGRLSIFNSDRRSTDATGSYRQSNLENLSRALQDLPDTFQIPQQIVPELLRLGRARIPTDFMDPSRRDNLREAQILVLQNALRHALNSHLDQQGLADIPPEAFLAINPDELQNSQILGLAILRRFYSGETSPSSPSRPISFSALHKTLEYFLDELPRSHHLHPDTEISSSFTFLSAMIRSAFSTTPNGALEATSKAQGRRAFQRLLLEKRKALELLEKSGSRNQVLALKNEFLGPRIKLGIIIAKSRNLLEALVKACADFQRRTK
jgi:hypothetical protein